MNRQSDIKEKEMSDMNFFVQLVHFERKYE